MPGWNTASTTNYYSSPATPRNLGDQYKDYWKSLEEQYNIPQGTLDWLARTESNYNPQAVSPAGALGMFQFMPSTIQQPGYGMQPQFGMNSFDPSNVEQSSQAAAQYFSAMMGQFGNNPLLAAGAYNAGPGTVQRYQQGMDLPRETQRYMEMYGAAFPQLYAQQTSTPQLEGMLQPPAEEGEPQGMVDPYTALLQQQMMQDPTLQKAQEAAQQTHPVAQAHQFSQLFSNKNTSMNIDPRIGALAAAVFARSFTDPTGAWNMAMQVMQMQQQQQQFEQQTQLQRELKQMEVGKEKGDKLDATFQKEMDAYRDLGGDLDQLHTAIGAQPGTIDEELTREQKYRMINASRKFTAGQQRTNIAMARESKQLDDEARQLGIEMNELKQRLTVLQGSAGYQEKAAKIDDYDKEIARLMAEMTQLKGDALAGMVPYIGERIATLTGEIRRMRRQVGELRTEVYGSVESAVTGRPPAPPTPKPPSTAEKMLEELRKINEGQ